MMLHSLKRSDRFAELLPSLGILHCNVERPLHTADQFGSQRGGGNVESSRELRDGSQFFRRGVAEFDDVEFSRKVHSGHGRYFQAGSFGVHHEYAVARHDDDKVGDRGIRDKEFLSGELSIGSGQLDIPRIPARTGFQNGDGSAYFSAADRRQIFVFERRGAHGIQDRASQHDGGKKRAGQERASGLFHQHHELHQPEADSAVLLRENDASVTLVRELGPESGVIYRVRFHQAPHFSAGTFTGEKLARAVFQKFLAFTQTKLHGVSA